MNRQAKQIDSGLCLYYRFSRCTMSGQCPWGKNRINERGVKECKLNGVIGTSEHKRYYHA